MNVLFAVFLLAMSLAVDLAAGQKSHLGLAYQNYLPFLHKSTIIFVDADAIGNADGLSWADAYTNLQPAFERAAAGDQIWVAAGTYYPSVEYCGTGSERYKSFQLKNGVAVYGGFDPSVSDVGWGDRDWVGNPTILSGDIGILGDNRDNSYHVFCHPFGFSLDSSAVLDGFVIQDGNANSLDHVNTQGGGMFNWDTSSPMLRNITFSNNSAILGGGMLNMTSLTLTNITFSNNTAYQDGGGIYSLSSPILTDVTFSHNSAQSFGGGMYNVGDPTLTNVTFSNNSTGMHGGGIYNDGSPILTNVTFSNNSSDWDGGGMFNYAYSPRLVGVTFSGNTAVYGGGGMYNSAASPTLVNVSFSGNTAVAGGGIYSNYSSPTLVNVTLYGNTAVNGGGLYNTNSELIITNCILWGNDFDEIFNDNSSLVVTYSDIQGGYSGIGNVDADPLFVDAPDGNLRLRGTSPIIDAGDNTVPALVGIITDLDGNPRFVDIPTIPDAGNGIAPIIDIGAYEAQGY